MDWEAAIEWNRAALTRVLAALVAMAGLGGEEPGILPRRLYRAVLRLLRPAEAATRRLVIAASRGLVVTLAPERAREGTPRKRSVSLPPPLTPPHKGEEDLAAAPRHVSIGDFGGNGGVGVSLPLVGRGQGWGCATVENSICDSPAHKEEGDLARGSFPSLLWGGVRGGGAGTPACRLGFRLFDPLPRFRPARPASASVPRISLPGFTRPVLIPVRPPLSPDDAIDAARLALRLAALGRVLDDLPRQAKRFARWQARLKQDADRREASPLRVNGGGRRRTRRIWPLRPGMPRGGRRANDEVRQVLNNTHGLALWALQRRNTS